jgi:hypothetical protein
LIYRIKPGEDIFDLNQGLLIVDEFRNLEGRQMMFVCLVADPSRDNPVRTLSGRDRREKAARLAGYPLEKDGRRINKNGRVAVIGQNKRIEAAIEKFKELHYDIRQRSIESLRHQIQDIQDLLTSAKRAPVIDKDGDLMVDPDGNILWVNDIQAMQLAAKLASDLPSLHEQLEKLEATASPEMSEPVKFDGATFTTADFDDDAGTEEDESDLSVADKLMLNP